MEIEYGTEVIDRKGKVLGTVDYIIRNTWTGEIGKFMVRRKTPESNLFFSPQDVLEVAKSKIKVSISSDELNESR
jgi:sporulation protein YlmC with PRC-barrel domain